MSAFTLIPEIRLAHAISILQENLAARDLDECLMQQSHRRDAALDLAAS
jgi:hypothetical protein